MTPVRPRLALVHYAAVPVAGGVERIMATHARLLRERGYDVRVIAGRGDAELVPEVGSRHPRVERVARELAAGSPASEEFASLRRLLRERLAPLLADRDLVIAHNVLTMPFNLPLAAALVDGGRPLVAWTHDIAWMDPRYAPYRRPGWPWSILHEPQPGARYVAVSQARREEIAAAMAPALPAGGITVVPNGVDELQFLGIGGRTRELWRRAGLTGADPLVLVPVRVVRRKRLELAVDAVAVLRARHPALRLVVSGPLGPHSGENRAYAEELQRRRADLRLHDEVRFLHELAARGGRHPVGDREIAELYRLADVVLLPSESEGFGLPVLEAALSRAPLVCADIPVLREVAGAATWTFPASGGPEAVAAAVERALASRAARLRRHALREFGWPVVMERVQRVVESGVGR